jgi:hypothetical protein
MILKTWWGDDDDEDDVEYWTVLIKLQYLVAWECESSTGYY